MTHRIIVPRHLQVLAEAWSALAQRLDRDRLPVLPCHTDEVDWQFVVQMRARLQFELDMIRSWIERLTEWSDGPLALALQDSSIADDDMRRTADGLSRFADELIELRADLRRSATGLDMAAAAPRIDAFHATLLDQVRDFAATVSSALDPEQLRRRDRWRWRRPGIALEFTFKPQVDREQEALDAWLDRVRRSPRVPAPASELPPEQTMEAASPSGSDWLVGLLGIAALSSLFDGKDCGD
jgi:hypothetical protein